MSKPLYVLILLFLEVLLIILYSNNQLQCEPCIPGSLCPPCISTEQEVIKILMIAVGTFAVFRLLWFRYSKKTAYIFLISMVGVTSFLQL